MEKGIFVKDFAPGQQVEGHFVVAGAKCGTASNGKTYWSVELQDASGKADAKIWDPLSSRIDDLPGNTVLWLRGGVTQFNNRLQVRIEDVRVLDDEERAATDVRWFVPSSPRDVDAMEAELRDICAREFTHPTWRDFAREILNDGEIAMALRIFPAAKSMHHAYAGGLLEHTLGVCRLCLAMSDCYPELDRQTLLAGALCHDLGKIREFSAGLTTDYTDDGRLMGHIIQGLAMLDPIFGRSGLEDGLRQHLTHLILSHHGLLEHGAVQVPQTAEAIVLHHADNVDAKLAMCRELTAKMDGESSWTEYHRGMGHAIFQPMRTPDSAQGMPVVTPEREATPEQGLQLGLAASSPELVTESASESVTEQGAEQIAETALQPRKRKKAESEQCLSLLKV